MLIFWQVDIMIWQVDINNWQVNIKIWQINIIIWQVMAEICHNRLFFKRNSQLYQREFYNSYRFWWYSNTLGTKGEPLFRSHKSLRWPIALGWRRRRASSVYIFFSRTTGPIFTNLLSSIYKAKKLEVVNFTTSTSSGGNFEVKE